jgi:chromosome segregation ATPase
MKRKMLANLEDEGGDVDGKRADERETIANTIRITDDALARKDREIAELKAQLVEGDSVMADAEESLRELVDSDEVITGHRDRIAKLEKEMQDKLRAAELELSVERAKIARETAQLADLKAELESQRSNREVDSAPGSATAASTAQHPRRRWLSKLGLSGEQEE